MSDQSTTDTPAQAQLRLERIYLKDASFESPRSPAVFGEAWKPEFSLDINTRTGRLDEQRFEVVLCATATLFPYVRETVDNMVVKGGFPAVHLAPVNFDALFAEAVRQQQAGAQSDGAPQH